MTKYPGRHYPYDPDETPEPTADTDHTPDEVTRRDRPAEERLRARTLRLAARHEEPLAETQPMVWTPGEDDVAAPTRPTAAGAGRRPEPVGTGRPDRPPVSAAGHFERAPGRAVEGAARPGVPAVPASGIPARPAGAVGLGASPSLPNPFETSTLPEPVGWTAGSADFWSALTSVERKCFLDYAELGVLPAGHVLWRQHEVADHVAVIWSGKVTIRVNQNGVERIVAVRGPGDLIGERAALLVRTRSATVVALDRLTVLRMPVGEFAAFLTAYPRVLAVLDQQMYARLTQVPDDGREAVPAEVTAVPAPRESGPPPVRRLPAPALEWAGQVCSIMFVDVVGFSATHRNDTDRLELRRILYEAVPEALEGSNVPWAACYHEDRGDGMLIVVPPQAPPARVVDPMLSLLTARLRRHNHAASEAMRLRIRMSLHIGPVMPDGEGVNGSAVIQAARLLDAPELRHRMADTDADVGFVASEYVFENVLAGGPGFINPRAFQRIRFRAKNAAYTGFMHLSQSTF